MNCLKIMSIVYLYLVIDILVSNCKIEWSTNYSI